MSLIASALNLPERKAPPFWGIRGEQETYSY